VVCIICVFTCVRFWWILYRSCRSYCSCSFPCKFVYGQKNPAGIKLQYFVSMETEKKNQSKNKVKHTYFRHIESESTTRFKNRFYSNLCFCQTHIWTSLLFIYLYQGVTHMENDLLFCSILKLLYFIFSKTKIKGLNISFSVTKVKGLEILFSFKVGL
jgi:hypothetical protein